MSITLVILLLRCPLTIEIPLCRRLDTLNSSLDSFFPGISSLSGNSSEGFQGGTPIAVYAREAHLQVMDRVVCVATGHIELFSHDCLEAIEGRNIGIGQLFRYLGKQRNQLMWH